MFWSNYQRWSRGANGFPGTDRHAWQWQPTTTSHDPNPPITLEDAAAPAVDDLVAALSRDWTDDDVYFDDDVSNIALVLEAAVALSDVVAATSFAWLDDEHTDDEQIDVAFIHAVAPAVDDLVAALCFAFLDDDALDDEPIETSFIVEIVIGDVVAASWFFDIQQDDYSFDDGDGIDLISHYEDVPAVIIAIDDWIIRARRRGRR